MNQADKTVRRRLGRVVCAGVTVTITAFAGLSVAASSPASAGELLNETFTGATVTPGAWLTRSPKGTHVPCLTAARYPAPKNSLPACNTVKVGARPEAQGAGAFQLTDNSKQDAGALLLNKAMPAGSGLHFEFDQFQYRTSTRKGADGISFFLIDGKTKNPDVGDAGGSLGYRNLPGAVIGVGFDNFGNFSNPKFWGKRQRPDKGPGRSPNHVVVRGAAATNYQYIKGVKAPAPLAVDKAAKRDRARRTVSVDISTANMMNVSMDFHDGAGLRPLIENLNLDGIPGQPKLPKTLKLGFAASTGNNTNYHEIQGFKASALDPDLQTKITTKGEFKPGGTGSYVVDVSSNSGGGPTAGEVKTTVTIPAGLTPKSASGDGWKCTNAGRQVTCARPGTGADTLRPGKKYPPINVVVTVPAGASGDKTVNATTDTLGEAQPADNKAAAKTTSTPSG